MPVVAIFACVCLSALFGVWFLGSRDGRAGAALFISVSGLSISVGGFNLLTLSTCLLAAMCFGLPNVRPQLVVVIIGAYSLWQVISLLWAPVPDSGLSPTASSLLLLAFVVLLSLAPAGGLSDVNRGSVLRLVGWSWPVVVTESLSTFVFQRNPEEKLRYLHSNLAYRLIGRSAPELFTTLPDNVLRATKSGGLLFVNANRDSMFLGASGMVFVFLGVILIRKFYLAVAIVAFASVLFTGSKTGIGLLLIVPVCVALVYLSSNVKIRLSGSLAVTLGLSLLLAAVVVVPVLASAYVSQSNETLAPRLDLWREALKSAVAHPLTGLGYGGWFQHWATVASRYGVAPRLPPHNYLLEAGVDIGFVGVLLIIALYVVAFRSLRGVLVSAGEDRRMRFGTACLFGVLLWIGIHGLGDNTDFFGSINTIPYFSLALCWPRLSVRLQSVAREEEATPAPPASRSELVSKLGV